MHGQSRKRNNINLLTTNMLVMVMLHDILENQKQTNMIKGRTNLLTTIDRPCFIKEIGLRKLKEPPHFTVEIPLTTPFGPDLLHHPLYLLQQQLGPLMAPSSDLPASNIPSHPTMAFPVTEQSQTSLYPPPSAS